MRSRGGDQQYVVVDAFELPPLAEDDELLAVIEALENLAIWDPGNAKLANCVALPA